MAEVSDATVPSVPIEEATPLPVAPEAAQPELQFDGGAELSPTEPLMAVLEQGAAAIQSGLDVASAPTIDDPGVDEPEPVEEDAPFIEEGIQVAGLLDKPFRTFMEFIGRGEAGEGAVRAAREAEGVLSGPTKAEAGEAVRTIGNVRKILGSEEGEPAIRPDIREQILELSTEGLGAQEMFVRLDQEAIRNLDDFPEIMEGIVTALRGADKDARAVQSIETTEKLALSLNMSPERLINARLNRAYNAEEMTAIRIMLTGNVQKLRELHAETIETPTPENYIKTRRHINLMSAMVLKFRDAKGEAGRALNSLKHSPKAVHPVAKKAETQDMFAQIGGKGSNEAFMQALGIMLESGDNDLILRFAEKSRNVTGVDMLYEAWINAFLGSPKTHVLNITANTGLQAELGSERWLAATYGALERGVIRGTGGTPTPGGVTFEEARAHTMSSLMGIRHAFREVWRAASTGQTRDAANKIDLGITPSISSANINQLPLAQAISPELLRQGGALAHIVDFLADFYYRGPGKLLLAEDIFFRGTAFAGEIHALAIREANRRGLKDSPDNPDDHPRSDFIANVLADPEKFAPELHVGAVDFSKYATLTNEPGQFGEAMNDVRLAAVWKGIPVGRVIVPFFRVINNLTAFFVDRVPFATQFAGKPGFEAFRGGSDPAARQIAASKWIAGAGLFASAAYVALNGGLSGRMTDDPRMLQVLRRQGKQQYSFFIPWTRIDPDNKFKGIFHNGKDESVSFNRMQPVPGTFFAVVGDTVTALAHTDDPDERENVVLSAMAALVPYMANQSFMTGVTSLMEATNPQSRWGDAAIRMLGSYIAQQVSSVPGAILGPLAPGTPLSGTIAREIDPIRRDTRPDPQQTESFKIWQEAVNKIYARTPGLSSTLAPDLDLWGEERPVDPGMGFDIMSPLPVRELKFSTKALKDAKLPEAMWRYKNFVGIRVGRMENGQLVGGEITQAQHRAFVGIVGIDGELERLGLPVLRPRPIIDGYRLPNTTEMPYVNELRLLSAGKKVKRKNADGKSETWSVGSRLGNLKKRLETLIKTKAYQRLSDDPEVANAKQDQIQRIVRKHRDIAKIVFLQMHPEIAEVIRKRKRGEASDAAAQTEATQ